MQKILMIENNILASNTIRRRLVESLMEHGYDVTILTTGTEEEIRVARKNNFNIIDIRSSRENVFEIFNYIRNLRRVIRTTKPDLCLTFTIRPTIWGNFACRMMNVPVISNITGIGRLFSENRITFLLARKLYKVALIKTRCVFFQNKDDYDLFLSHHFIKEENAKIIPGSGVDTEYFSPASVSLQNPFTFLFIGRLLIDKGIVEFIRAAEIIKRKYPDVVFQIVGPLWDQNLKSNSFSQKELNHWISAGTVIYKGSTLDVRKFIAAADCIVLPSYREGMSNVLLEAGSMSKPCIATNVTGCREIVEDGVTGYLCKVADARDLADKMEMMLNTSLEKRENMGREARKKMKDKFEKSIVINEYLRAIHNVLNS